MSPWPGAPKSAASPPINKPSVRFPYTLNEHSTMGDVADAMRTVVNGLTVHEQAFANLPSQISTQAAATAQMVVENIASENVTTSVTAFNAKIGAVLFFPGLFEVNNQIGQDVYELQPADNGRLILLADSSAITLEMNAFTPPYGCFVSNMGSSMMTMFPDSGALINNDSSLAIQGPGWAINFFDGNAWWSLGISS